MIDRWTTRDVAIDFHRESPDALSGDEVWIPLEFFQEEVGKAVVDVKFQKCPLHNRIESVYQIIDEFKEHLRGVSSLAEKTTVGTLRCPVCARKCFKAKNEQCSSNHFFCVEHGCFEWHGLPVLFG